MWPMDKASRGRRPWLQGSAKVQGSSTIGGLHPANKKEEPDVVEKSSGQSEKAKRSGAAPNKAQPSRRREKLSPVRESEEIRVGR